MHPGPDSRKFPVHDHRPGGVHGRNRPERLALEVRHTADGAADTADGQDCEFRVPRHTCVAAVSDDTAADRFLTGLLNENRPGLSVSVYGVDAHDEPEAVEQLVGVAPSPVQRPDLPVHDALMESGTQKGLSPERAEQRTSELADALDLHAVRDTPCAGLSPGLRSRVSLGCALLNAPPLLLLVRPLDDVDIASEKIICRVLDHYTASTGAVVFTTRSTEVAHRVADRLLHVDCGDTRRREGETGC